MKNKPTVVKDKKWRFCNTELKSEKGYYSDYYCPKCGSESGLVNIIGLCATKVEIK